VLDVIYSASWALSSRNVVQLRRKLLSDLDDDLKVLPKKYISKPEILDMEYAEKRSENSDDKVQYWHRVMRVKWVSST
jgi:hypothetical protein